MVRKRLKPAAGDWEPPGGWETGKRKGTQRETRQGTTETQQGSGVYLDEAAGDGRLADDAGRKARYAASALQAVIADTEASGQARASAARTLAEMAGAIGRHQQAPLDRAAETRVSLLSRAELERELARLRLEIARKSSA